MNIAPRFDVHADQIDRVVAAFYVKMRGDAELGPVFSAHVTDWPMHEAKITRFWRNAILNERSYSGNPMKVHMEAGDVRPEHFARWLAAFDATLREELDAGQAQAWSALAHRIGNGLRSGLLAQQGRFGAVPDLT